MLLCDWCDKSYSTYCLVLPIENVPGSVPSILTTKRWEEEEELLPQPKAGYVEEKQVEQKILESDQENEDKDEDDMEVD